jgi:hypothetical protein
MGISGFALGMHYMEVGWLFRLFMQYDYPAFGDRVFAQLRHAFSSLILISLLGIIQ